MDKRMEKMLFREMLLKLEDSGKCSQEYHELGESLGLIEPSDQAYAYPAPDPPKENS